MKKSIKNFAFGIFVLASLTGAVSCSKKESAKSGVRVVNVAHTDYYRPYDFVNEKGESDGFEVAVLKAVDEILPQYEFRFHGVSDDELLIGVETGKYQVGTKGAWVTEERKKKFVIPSEPIGASVIGIAYRASDKDKITSLETLAEYNGGGKLVPIAPQNAQYNIIQEYNQAHPDKQIKLLPSEIFEISDAYTWVLEGRYDAYFSIKLAYESNVVNENAPYHKFADQLTYTPYKGIPTWPLFNKAEQEFADAYDGAIKTLRENGTITELSNKFFGEDVFSFVTD